jgi:serine/threonine protein kinase
MFVRQMKLCAVYKRYDILNQLGSGAFGTVWKACQRKTKTQCAMKAIDKKKFEGLGAAEIDSMIFREIQLMSNLSHPNIVDILDVFETPRFVTIALELCTGGDLADLLLSLKKRREYMSESIAQIYFRQILSALNYLHTNRVAHRDLKPENVMLKHKIKNIHVDVPVLKLADFGLARATGSRGLMTTFCGTPYYVAPEVIEQNSSSSSKGPGYSSSVDMWSAGVMLYEMLTGTRPFEDSDGRTLFQKITRALRHDFRVSVKSKSSLSISAMDLLNGLLRRPDGMIRRRSHRMTASECLEHSWMHSEKRKRGNDDARRKKDLKRHKTVVYENSPKKRATNS